MKESAARFDERCDRAAAELAAAISHVQRKTGSSDGIIALALVGLIADFFVHHKLTDREIETIVGFYVERGRRKLEPDKTHDRRHVL